MDASGTNDGPGSGSCAHEDVDVSDGADCNVAMNGAVIVTDSSVRCLQTEPERTQMILNCHGEGVTGRTRPCSDSKEPRVYNLALNNCATQVDSGCQNNDHSEILGLVQHAEQDSESLSSSVRRDYLATNGDHEECQLSITTTMCDKMNSCNNDTESSHQCTGLHCQQHQENDKLCPRMMTGHCQFARTSNNPTSLEMNFKAQENHAHALSCISSDYSKETHQHMTLADHNKNSLCVLKEEHSKGQTDGQAILQDACVLRNSVTDQLMEWNSTNSGNPSFEEQEDCSENCNVNQGTVVEALYPDQSEFCKIGILDLPLVILLNVLKHFNIPELLQLSVVCRQFYQVVFDSQLWRDLNFHKHKAVPDSMLCRLTSISPSLHRLNLSECNNVTEQGFCMASGHWQSLQEIKLFRSKFLTNRCLESLGSFCYNLRVVDLTLCSQITDEGIAKLAEGCHLISSLILDQCHRLTDDGIVAIAENCPKLQTLSLDMCENITDYGLIKVTEHCSLKKLLLNQSRATAATMSGIARNCPLIEFLDMKYHHTVTDEAVLDLVQSCPLLKTLNLSLCFNVTDASVVNILVNCKKLERLYLIGCNITNRGLHYFGDIGCQLERLDVSWCNQISDEGVQALVKSCPSIKHIGLMRCDQVSPRVVTELMDSHPCLFLSTLITEMNQMLQQKGLGHEMNEFTVNANRT